MNSDCHEGLGAEGLGSWERVPGLVESFLHDLHVRIHQ